LGERKNLRAPGASARAQTPRDLCDHLPGPRVFRRPQSLDQIPLMTASADTMAAKLSNCQRGKCLRK
jgi:hypothetical protein